MGKIPKLSNPLRQYPELVAVDIELRQETVSKQRLCKDLQVLPAKVKDSPDMVFFLILRRMCCRPIPLFLVRLFLYAVRCSSHYTLVHTGMGSSVRVRLRHATRMLCQRQLLLPVLVRRLVESAMYASRGSILKMARRKVRLDIGDPAARYVVLVIELPAVCTSRVILMLLMSVPMMLVVLVVLEGFAQTHRHSPISVRSCPAIHHNIMTLVAMTLIIHAELLGRLRPGRS